MAYNADISHPEDTTVGRTPSGRIFKSFRRWQAVPESELLRLRHVLQCWVDLDRLAAARDLLRLVDAELTHRAASSEGVISPGRRPSAEEPGPEPG
jgi:hypothetical protein